MKRTFYFGSFAVICVASLIGCSNRSDTVCGLKPLQCTFTKTELVNDSAQQTRLPGDTPETYSYNTNTVAMDSLLNALCEKGISIKEAWYCPNDAYICKDAIGPRPVVILTKVDTSMLSYGFVQGNNGRLSCGMTLERYKP